MAETTNHKTAAILRGNAPFGERVAARADQDSQVHEGAGSNHSASATMFPFASLKPGRVRHHNVGVAMPSRAITRRELAAFIAALQD